LNRRPALSDLRPNIWRLQAQFNTQGLIEALKNDDAGIRKRAAAALRTMGATEAIPTLQQMLKVEQDPDARHAITAALDHLLPEQSEKVPTLIAQLQSSQPEAIIYAARALGEIKDKTAVEALILVFHNPQLSGRVRLAAAEALIKLESAPAVVTLLAALRSANWRIRRNAAAVLGQLKADWAVDSLLASLDDENEAVGRTARAAIRRIGTPEALEALGAVDGEEIHLHKVQTAKLPTTQPLQPPVETPKPEKPTPSPPPEISDSAIEKADKPSLVETRPSPPALPPTAVTTSPTEPSHPETGIQQKSDAN
jgi:HEAT repeats/PBS lyase HEAT-like repeat